MYIYGQSGSLGQSLCYAVKAHVIGPSTIKAQTHVIGLTVVKVRDSTSK